MKDKSRSIIENWKTVSSLNVNWKIPMIKAWHLKKNLTFYSQLINTSTKKGGYK